jgi:hypothetical protein
MDKSPSSRTAIASSAAAGGDRVRVFSRRCIVQEIINGHARITRQEIIVRDLDGNGGDGAGAKALLQTFTLTQQAYADYRHKILKAIDGGEL